MKKKLSMISLILTLALFASACGTKSTDTPAASTASTQDSPAATAAPSSTVKAEKPLTKVKQILAWFSQPEDAGLYAAVQQGYYKDAGLDVTIQPGSPQVSAVQLVASGKADFGLSTGDKVLLARSEGLPLVAVFATFQKSPIILMSKKGKGYNDFSELSGRTVFVTPGSAYWEFIKKKYKLTNVKELAYFGDITAFLASDNAIAQSYSTNEPFALSQKGVETEFKFAFESGFNPYDNVLFTTEAFIKDHPDQVKAYVEAIIKGWDYYKDKYLDVNDYILQNNPNGTKEGFKFASEKQKDLMYIDDALTKGFGYMSKERWSALQDQMLDLAIIKNKVNIDTLFTIDYLPKSAK